MPLKGLKNQGKKEIKKGEKEKSFKKWEYKITRTQLQKSLKEGEEIIDATFYCDEKGHCFLHDSLYTAEEMIGKTFNEEGKRGWELVQLTYHLNELMCIWKRAVV